MSNTSHHHQAVLMQEVLQALNPQPNQYYIDATFGRGGHSSAIMTAGGKVIAFDFDQESIVQAKERFAHELATGQLILQRENFNKMEAVIANLKKSMTIEVSGILFDFGTSTDQLMSTERGFSFDSTTEVLDMRMDNRLGVRACDLLKLLDERQMASMFQEYGGEEHAKAIARKIVALRKTNPQALERVDTLVAIIKQVKRFNPHSHLHPATKVFQALRVVVNDELSNIETALPQALTILRQSQALHKRLVCIAFHEGEDRIVKTLLKQWESQGLGTMINKKAITASEAELQSNPRARSAKLRALAL